MTFEFDIQFILYTEEFYLGARSVCDFRAMWELESI